ncbi:MAG: [FeFe] hydrogenase H-cluster radical SAM maturase HydG [Chlamydiae bacterium]|nr:[FeFe] hydrogenase H-cluster radical SAM maturase HydG [Chlamydiota bacterium]
MFDENEIYSLIEKGKKKSGSITEVKQILAKAKKQALCFSTSSEYVQGLSEEETAVLLNLDSSNLELMQELFDAALYVKRAIYGNRIVIFAPLYVSNYCQGGCLYCGFRHDNKAIKRKKLNHNELIDEVKALQAQGHKRLLMLMGDDPAYTLDEFVEAIHVVSSVKTATSGEIRRINVEIPALDKEDFKKLKATDKIGTYTLFQETYHRPTYQKVHPYGPKKDYDWRLNTMDRALESGMDDVGIGVLFGLYDYRFEVLSLLKHANHLDKKYGIGPHTISVPRIQSALNTPFTDNLEFALSDLDFKKVVAIIRLAVPYTGIILSTRENEQMRREVYNLGVSQISAGSKTEPGGYHEEKCSSGQFFLNDIRPTHEVIYDLVKMGFIPSWCTACYRLKRTGKVFMQIAKKGEIQDCCHPNALLSFIEYLLDYADQKTRELGLNLIDKEIATVPNLKKREQLIANIEKLKNGTRDLFI